MKALLILFACALCAGPTLASQTSLASGINSVYAVQHQRDLEYAAEQAAAQQAAEREHRREVAEMQAAREEAARQQAKVLADREAARRRNEALAAAERKRNQAYQDQLRQLQIKKEKLDLQAKKTAVSRENDFINAKLSRQKAETNVIQSQADANRKLSTGAEVLMEKTGEAKLKRPPK